MPTSASVAKFVPVATGTGGAVGERPVLELRSSTDPKPTDDILLGRNGGTKITEPRMSRQLARVYWNRTETGPELFICAFYAHGTVELNAKHLKASQTSLLTNGDVISLVAPDFSAKYDYRVDIMSGETAQSTSQPSFDISAVVAGSKRQETDAAEEFSCAICLDIMVEPVTAVPCGHCFCRTCLLDSVRECHTCRSALTGRPVPARSLGQAIALLVEHNPDLFASDDVEQYRTRTVTENLATAKSNRATPSHVRPKKRIKRTLAASATAPNAGGTADSAIVID